MWGGIQEKIQDFKYNYDCLLTIDTNYPNVYVCY